MNEQKTFTTMVGDKELTIKTGKFAQAANGTCMVQLGETVVLATAVMSERPRPGIPFFPLMVDFEEKLYAAGRIKGSRFIKREGRPTDEAVLVARFIDRSLRPLFNQEMRNDVQVIITVLAFDGENDADLLGLIGASCALHISDIPWNGPIGIARVSKLDDEWLVNPTYAQRDKADFDLDVAGTSEKAIMIEARASETPEDVMAEAFEKAMGSIQPVIDLIEKIRKDVGKEKRDMVVVDERGDELRQMAKDYLYPIFEKRCIERPLFSKPQINAAKAELKDQLTAHLTEQGIEEAEIKIAADVIYNLTQRVASDLILKQGKRVDGRALTEIRELTGEVGLLPRVHGSGHFNRGTTQVMSICTLGAPGDEQTLDGMETVGQKRYMHHYNFPPYSVGEAKPLRGASRRDIGHGALAEKALDFMIPSKEDFPYTIRVVSEVLDSNGSSSMASTCASTLALMDAGVPIKAPVAGIAMGLASSGDDWKVITDLQDIEDGDGGMDFKITGTKTGLTAIQMDTKTDGITLEIIKQTLTQWKDAKATVLAAIAGGLEEPRKELSEHAPRILTMMINPDKIRDVIGPGGKMINEIIAETGVDSIDIEQDGYVFITAPNQTTGEAAFAWVGDLTREVQANETFTKCSVERIMDFGAFVNILPGRDGLVHISELAPWRVAKVEDIVKVGDEVNVKVIEIDSMGRVNLSMKQAEGNTYTDEMKEKASKAPAPRSGGAPRGGSRPPRKS
ncbi:polyribonucleotide nucleotidyltransferase [Candidatus Uhrbacteria bacterium]|jgi:polyribonucleotide nucleotidyltransferase|nr:polyribonucleotide nucleotidyltransferase [Candidatus Uhrbacteria bacterium]